MSLDFQQVYAKIKEIGQTLQQRKEVLEKRREQARALMIIYADALDTLRNKVEEAKQADPNTRCALPVADGLNARIAPPPLPQQATLIAADGSQINPDRHAATHYYVINVGAIAMQVGSGKIPEVFTDTQLHMLDEFEDTFFSDSQVALQRDVAERKKLLEIAKNYSGIIIALTEGQLELWGAIDTNNAGEYEKSLQDYIDSLRELEKREVITSGYVDKPGANWLVRLLEIATIPQNELNNLRKYHPLAGVTDRWLFEQILGKHERSAIFALQARSAEKYTDTMAIHFFYLNVGDEKKPAIARVDIPAWVANSQEAVNNLHIALIEQTKLMSNKPFPYLLHRAHEIAVVTHQEKEQVDQMLIHTIRNNGGEIGEVSGKQSAKNLPGRTSYK